jgi:hypothetical protein
MDDGYIPPMMLDDFAALAALAGPLYQESRIVESFTSNNPMPGTHKDNGSMAIKQSLEQAQQLARNSVVRPPQPMYVPPAIPLDIPDPIMGTASYTPYVQPAHNPQLPTPDPSDQLEFSFNVNEQTVTNDLLREISKKLTKVISLLEKSTKEDTIVPKLKQNAKNNQV